MSQRDAAQILRAGGIVPRAAAAGEDAVGVVARGYHHPALPGRTVVRLVAEPLVAGDDLEMATLGFGPGEDRGPVGAERKRALGFPGWALVHDPANARQALDVVKELKLCARTARLKPGNAKDALTAIAARLGRTVPQFLPAFFEEAGRMFLGHGAPGFAAVMFGKAREAEAVHALAVDEQHRVDAFVEFTLAGAVTTKALADYARQLAEHHAPAVAYRHFRQLCVQRTLGGMPPWAGMARDLRRLAKAAGLDPGAEDAALLGEILESPALSMAPAELWRAYREPIAALGRGSPAVRRVLLELFPSADGDTGELDAIWLDLLDDSGASEALVGDAPAAARPAGGRAAWFNKLTQHMSRHWRDRTLGPRVLDLLRRMAPRLAEDGAPITCCTRWFQLDLDLAELALGLGVPVAPPERVRLALGAWAKRAGEPEHGCDPVRVAADPRLGPLLVSAVAAAIGDAGFDAAARGKAGFLAAKRAWLDGLLAGAEAGALPAIGDALATVGAKVGPELFAELPDLHARLAALDVAPALARTLRIGLVDELGWPALEDAARELGAGGVALYGGLPAVVLVAGARAIAVGPAGRLAEHDLVLPARHELLAIRYIAGQFLVVLKQGFHVRGYWSAAPQDRFDSDASPWQVQRVAARAAVLDDGAWLEGGRAIRPGDRAVPVAGLAAYDGTTAWIAEHHELRHRMRELSASGEPGRVSWPAWLEAGLAADWQIDADLSYVLPAPAGLAASPLGLAGGALGLRAVYRGAAQNQKTASEVVGIDGRRWTGPPALRVAGLVALPGGEPRPLVDQTRGRDATITAVFDPAGGTCGLRFAADDPRSWRGSVAPYPPALWHALRPRDVAGSQRLRAIRDGEARALLDATAGIADLVPTGAVARVLPEIAHDRLRLGVAGAVALAAELARARDQLRDERAPGRANRRAAVTGPDDAALREALAGWVEPRWGEGSAVRQIARCGELFRSPDRRDRVELEAPSSQLDWLPLAVLPGALVFLATAIAVPAEHRRAIAGLLAVLAAELPDPARLRVWSGAWVDAAPEQARAGMVLLWSGGNGYAILRHAYRLDVHVLEYAPDGAFRALPQIAPGAVTPGAAWGAELVAAAATGAPRHALTDAAALAEATGLTGSEAVHLLAGCPRSDTSTAAFLDKPRREALGLKAAQAAIARDAMRAIPRGVRLAVLDEAGRGGDLAAAWLRRVGKRVPVPEALVAEADRALDAPIPAAQALAMFAGATAAPRLTCDASWTIGGRGELLYATAGGEAVRAAQAGDRAFTGDALYTACAYLPFLYAALPVGDPLRAQAPRAHALVLERLAHPQLLIELGTLGVLEGDRPGVERLVAALGGTPIDGLAERYTGWRVPGAVIVQQSWVGAGQVLLTVHLQPARLDDRAIAALRPLVSQVHGGAHHAGRALEVVRSADLAAMMARIAESPLPPGGWEQNPALSAPALVDAVAGRLGVARDAAALYLQYLVLLWPTPKNLARWNAWKPRQLEAATAELAGRGLILAARRERAQRGYFLPGGWEALASPQPPMESWKVALYSQRTYDRKPAPVLAQFAPLAPFHVLYARAWQRIEAGDAPRYAEVSEGTEVKR